ncbi:hypothetical protein HDU92_007083 [Lobulomyces angularis]|nr:hypothetical protein HDU92_007083 [Lobulomyces angularis]
MADRKATNKYYPPDWDPSKGSINKFVGQHPLRHRARKLDQGILVVRFELPFNMWCLHCNGHVGMGVRYNAEKKKIGNYFSTPIFSFKMKCHLCSGMIEIQTDPKECEYKVIEGGKKKEEEWDPRENETLEIKDEAEAEKIEKNAFYKLENDLNDKKISMQKNLSISQIQEWNEINLKDTFTQNQKLRKKFRTEKKKIQAIELENNTIRDKYQLNFNILKESESDVNMSKTVKFDNELTLDAKKAIKLNQEIFLKNPVSATGAVFDKSSNVKLALEEKKKLNLLELKEKASTFKARSLGLSSISFSNNVIEKQEKSALLVRKQKASSKNNTAKIEDDANNSNAVSLICDYSCILSDHSRCVVRSYVQWLEDSDYEPVCGICKQSLDQGALVRFSCLDLFHVNCVNSICDQQPDNTAPAGFLCFTCHEPILPADNNVTQIANLIRTTFKDSKWGKNCQITIPQMISIDVGSGGQGSQQGSTVNLHNSKSTVSSPALEILPPRSFTLSSNYDDDQGRGSRVTSPKVRDEDDDKYGKNKVKHGFFLKRM